LKDLHVEHISEKSRLESALSVTRSELETVSQDKSTKVERLEASLASMEHIVRENEEKYQNNLLKIQREKKDDYENNLHELTLKYDSKIKNIHSTNKLKMEHVESDYNSQLESIKNQLNVEISSHHESSKNADLALSRLRDTLDRERDLQVTSLNEDKLQAERHYKQKLSSEIDRHQTHANQLRVQITSMTETMTELEAKLRLLERDKTSQLRQKDEELLKAMEKNRIEHSNAHKTTVQHYESTIHDLQASLVATRARLSDVENKHQQDVDEIVLDRNKLTQESIIDTELKFKMLSKGLEKEQNIASEARMSEQRSRSELNEKQRELEDIHFAHQVALREAKEQFQHQIQVSINASYCIKKASTTTTTNIQ